MLCSSYRGHTKKDVYVWSVIWKINKVHPQTRRTHTFWIHSFFFYKILPEISYGFQKHYWYSYVCITYLFICIGNLLKCHQFSGKLSFQEYLKETRLSQMNVHSLHRNEFIVYSITIMCLIDRWNLHRKRQAAAEAGAGTLKVRGTNCDPER